MRKEIPADRTASLLRVAAGDERAGHRRLADSIVRWIGGGLCLLGILVLLGWAFDLAVLKSVLPHAVNMKSVAAICFVLLGVSIWLAQVRTPWARTLMAIFTLIVMVTAFATLIEYPFGVNMHVDQVLFREPPGTPGTRYPGRMSPTASIEFVLMGLSLLLVTGTWRMGLRVAYGLGLTAASIAWLSIVGYIFGATSLIGLTPYTHIALHTSAGFMCGAVAVLVLQPDGGVLALMSGSRAGKVFTRRLLPIVLIVPTALGWLVLAAERDRLFDSSLAMALHSVTATVLLSIAAWITGSAIDRAAVQSERTEQARAESDQHEREVSLLTESARALRAAEARLHGIVETVAEGIVLASAQGQIIFANSEAERLLGLTRSKITARSYDDPLWKVRRLDGSPLPHEEYPITRVLSTGRSVYDVENRLQRPDGSWIALSVNATPLTDEAGVITGAVASFSDVTARVETEMFRVKRTQQLQEQAALLDLAHDAIIVMDPGTGVIRFWNRGAETMYGWTQSEALGSVSHELLRTEFSESRALTIATALETGAWEGELTHYDRDGRRIVVASRWAARRVNGVATAILEINRDITLRVQAEAQVRHLNAELESRVHSRTSELESLEAISAELSRASTPKQIAQIVVDRGVVLSGATVAVVALANADGRTLGVIASHGYPEEEMRQFERYSLDEPVPSAEAVRGGMPLWLQIDTQVAALYPELIRARGAIRSATAAIPLRVGDRVIGSLSFGFSSERFFSDADKRFMLSVADLCAQSIDRARAYDEEKQRSAALAVSNQELESFAYSVAHDLRQPLRGLDGFSQALLEDYGTVLDAEGQEYLRRIRRGTQQMGHLITDLLALSRISRRPLRRERVDLSWTVHIIANNLTHLEPERSVEFIIAENVSADADLQGVRTILEHLIDNAWKFTSRHDTARIEFGTIRHGGDQVFFVRDDGAGFDMRYVDKLFRSFSRLHSSSLFDGNGVGLATVQRLIEMHGGRTWAEAEVEKGATFYFVLAPTRHFIGPSEDTTEHTGSALNSEQDVLAVTT